MAAGKSQSGVGTAIVAVVFAATVSYMYGHYTGRGAAEADMARLLRADEVSSECRAQINNAGEAAYRHDDAKRDAYRGHSRY